MEILNIIGFIIGVLGLIFSIYQFNERKKLENFTLKVLRGTAGNVCKIKQSTAWADNNIRELQKLAVNLDESELKKSIILKISDAQGDAAASDRLVINLFNELLTFQDANFKTKEINHPEKATLNLWLASIQS